MRPWGWTQQHPLGLQLPPDLHGQGCLGGDTRSGQPDWVPAILTWGGAVAQGEMPTGRKSMGDGSGGLQPQPGASRQDGWAGDKGDLALEQNSGRQPQEEVRDAGVVDQVPGDQASHIMPCSDT